jgi:hypothetical protein
MNSIRILDIDRFASLETGFACAPVYSAYRFVRDETAWISLGNEDKTGMT